MKKKFILIATFALALLVLAACGKSSASKPKNPEIVTSFYPMYAFTKAIVGNEDIKVTDILPSNQDVHEYEPSAKDVAKMTNAQALVYNDNKLEKWADKVNTKGAKIEASKAVDMISSDPHSWLSPKEAITEVKTIEEGLEKVFPDKKAAFQKNTAAFVEQLEKLNDDYAAGLKNVKQKVIVTQHDAFSYPARDYGLKAVPVAGVDPEQEPSAAVLADLKKEIQKYGVKYVYTEMNTNDAIAKTLAENSGAKLVKLNTLETEEDLKLDAPMNYIKLMEENLKTLESTLNE